MLVVAVVVLAILGLGYVMDVPWRARFVVLGLVYVAVLGLHVILPDSHPLRESMGGGVGPWLVLGGGIALVVAYRAVLGRLRRQVVARGTAEPAAPIGPFSDDELERYARHITLPEIGGTGQRKLKEARVLVVGAGGLGAPVLLYLAAAGVGRIAVIDADVVSLSNLQRQVIHKDAGQGQAKVFSAAEAMAALNPFVEVSPYRRVLTTEIAADLFAEYDLVVDGTDQFDVRAMVNAAAVAVGVPLVSGAISAWEGQVTIYDPSRGAPCMACVFPEPPAEGLARTCAETGVVGALPGVVGSMMALEVVKEVTGAGEGLRGRLMMFDGLSGEVRQLAVARRTGCAVCGG